MKLEKVFSLIREGDVFYSKKLNRKIKVGDIVYEEDDSVSDWVKEK